MLDRASLNLLEYLNRECLNKGYKIFELEEILKDAVSLNGMDKDLLLQSLENLNKHEYICIKYIDQKEVCLSPLSKGRLESEKRLDDEIQNTLSKKSYFLYSFLGGLTGSSVIAVILAIIGAIIG